MTETRQETEGTVTAAQRLATWERIKPKPLHVFCHPSDLDRITAACEGVPTVKVVASRFVPAGQVYTFRGEL